MDTQFPTTHDLAQRLLALEAASQTVADAPAHPAVRVLEKLRSALSRFAGLAGFTALLGRALALARADFPSLKAVNVGKDGRLEGLEGLFAGTDGPGDDAVFAITTYLLGLLVIFIGEPLTLQLVRETWPGVSLAE